MPRRILLPLLLLGLGYILITHAAVQAIAAGTAIFLFGILSLERGFRALTGGVLERLLARWTRSVARSQILGFSATAIMQSSSVVTVLTIATLSAGLISLTSGIAIVFGANIGTTTGAWLMAGPGLSVDIASWGMPLLVIGMVLIFQKQKTWRGSGSVMAGVGFVFLGIHYMREGFSTFSDVFDLSRLAMTGAVGLVVYVAIGLMATVMLQSSHATLMLTIAALHAGQLTYDNALGLAIGSNIGTTVTAMVGAVGAGVEGRRLAWAHVVFNVTIGVCAMVLIEPFKWAVDGVTGFLEIPADDWEMKLAAFHTMFNVTGVILMTPFLGSLAALLERKIRPRGRDAEHGVDRPHYLRESALALPDAALEVLQQELEHLMRNVVEVLAHGLNLNRRDIRSSRPLDEVVAGSRQEMDIDVMQRYYESVKSIYGAIIDFAVRAPAAAVMDERQTARIQGIRLACRDAAEIVKLLATMRPNVNRYMLSPNETIRIQYDRIRLRIARALREILRIEDPAQGEALRLTVIRMKQESLRPDAVSDGTLDRLVRAGTITPPMATSLMNDSAAAGRIIDDLIEIARVAFTVEAQGKEAPAAQRS